VLIVQPPCVNDGDEGFTVFDDDFFSTSLTSSASSEKFACACDSAITSLVEIAIAPPGGADGAKFCTVYALHYLMELRDPEKRFMLGQTSRRSRL